MVSSRPLRRKIEWNTLLAAARTPLGTLSKTGAENTGTDEAGSDNGGRLADADPLRTTRAVPRAVGSVEIVRQTGDGGTGRGEAARRNPFLSRMLQQEKRKASGMGLIPGQNPKAGPKKIS